ncbi:nuclear transport factor 2-like protein [Pedobacter metabolipauper]|uniref:SnoaL-like protein n=1 Tax=Pedobacter metabolipauper TaxID=425513 RepID=A0A4R6SYU0_9SPHI|nr:hypothetical protein [Pedobacter metabolipauper]TDQ11774.1 hypothetical protein ATK78_0902 [Pedobacter metabolipauper]
MKKLIFISLMVCSFAASAQTAIEKNGTIYKKHPYITIVESLERMMAKMDTIGMVKYYADTAYAFGTGAPETKGIASIKAGWRYIANEWEIVSITPNGYPDALEYTNDPFTVQSWWVVKVVNKKTKKQATFFEVIFHSFNKDGKISSEMSFHDSTPLLEAMK